MTVANPADGHDKDQDHECGKNHCHARKRDGSGYLCHRPAGWGTPNAGTRKRPGAGPCKLHGGSTASHVVAGQRELLRQAAATYGTPIEIDPATALLQELYNTQGIVVWLGALIAQLQQEEIVLDDRPNTLIQIYQAERTHLVRVAKDAFGVDAAGRLTAVWEQLGSDLIALVGRVMDRIGLDDTQRSAIPAALIAELTALQEGRLPDDH